MTEAEAKTKACFRASTFGGSHQLASGPGPHCIASYCMAWRWQAPQQVRGEVQRVHGFCGLAGVEEVGRG